MEVNAYVLRAVLARQDLDDEGAAGVGTSPKENLGGAITVEAALRHMAQFGNDLSGFNKYIPYLLTLGREKPLPFGGAGITISGSSEGDTYRIDAKGTITSDVIWTNPGVVLGGTRVFQPDLRFSNMWLPHILSDPNYNASIILIDPLGVDVGNTFTVKVQSDSFPPVPGGAPISWWSGINWTGGQAPDVILPTPPDFGGVTLYCFIKISTSRYDGFVVGSQIP